MAEASSSASSSSPPSHNVGTGSSINSRGGSFSSFSDSVGRRLDESSLMRRGRTAPEEIALPEIGERTIFVTDEGLVDTAEFEQLQSEFRNGLGLLPEEQQELSEVFKVRIGLATSDRDQVDRLADEIDSAMTNGGQRRDDTMQRNRIDNYADRHFQEPDKPPVQFTSNRLRRPLLAKDNVAERRASLAIWVAIHRFIDGVSLRKPSGMSKVLEAPIISQVWDLLEAPDDSQTQQSAGLRRSTSASADGVTSPADDDSRSRRLSLKKLFTSRSSKTTSRHSRPTSTSQEEQTNDDTSLLTNYVIDGIPSTEIDLANYIVAHGILNKKLRDEIYCQLCCVVTKNPSQESRHRGWMLHLLCAGCFLPSIEFLSYYYAFLYEVSAEGDQKFANVTRRTLRRTNSNGMRFHPPSSIELAAARVLCPMQLDVALPDGRSISVNVDSASTSAEICEMISSNINVKDSFGFSLHITISEKVSSLGSGLDHVMDAINECEQLVRSQGRLESTASWRLFYRKELFTPWYNPNLDQVATDLIYRQIIDNVRHDDYRLHNDDIVTYVARCLYVEYGRNVQLDVAKSKMSEYFPRSYLAKHGGSSRTRDALARAVMASFERQGFAGYAVPSKFIQHELVVSASLIWPTHFSAMFEAYCIEGPALPRNDVILAVNSSGVFMLDSRYDVVVGFHFYDIIYIKADNSSGEIRNANVSLLAVDGAEFKLLCPNSETVERIVTAFLDGLRRRSRWAIALDQSTVPVQDLELMSTASSSPLLDMKVSDLVELLDSDVTGSPSTSRDESRDVEVLYGRNETTGQQGSFTASCVYILPTMEKPTTDFVSLLKEMTRETMDTLPRTRRTLAIARSTHDESAV